MRASTPACPAQQSQVTGNASQGVPSTPILHPDSRLRRSLATGIQPWHDMHRDACFPTSTQNAIDTELHLIKHVQYKFTCKSNYSESTASS